MSLKMIIVLILFLIFLIFIFQNIETVTVSFLMFDISMPRALLLVVTFAIGLLMGIFIPVDYKKHK
jgi:putative membrane protein